MGKNILVGVCGGISSYKTCYLVRLLRKEGYSVKVVMTENATKFVTPLVFQTLSESPVYVDMFIPKEKETNVKHISLADWCNLCVIAPVSANTLSKIANGICDNLLTTVVCALPQKVKVILAPAMNVNMWNNPFVRKNLEKLKKFKRFIILSPQKGTLACGVYGEGKMVEPHQIVKKIKEVLKSK